MNRVRIWDHVEKIQWQAVARPVIHCDWEEKNSGDKQTGGSVCGGKKGAINATFFLPHTPGTWRKNRLTSQGKACHCTHYVIFFLLALPPESHLCVCQQLFFLRRNSQIKADVTSVLLIKEFCCNCRGIPVFVWNIGLPVTAIQSMRGAVTRRVMGPKVRGVLEQARPRAGWWLRRKDTTANRQNLAFPVVTLLQHMAMHCWLKWLSTHRYLWWSLDLKPCHSCKLYFNQWTEAFFLKVG